MPVSPKTALAQAKRHLGRIEEDKASFRLRISGFAHEAQEKALRWFLGILEKQREYVQDLEKQISN